MVMVSDPLTIEVTLPLQNESSVPLKLCLEPLCEYFLVQPGQKIKIHAIINRDAEHRSFTVAPNDLLLTIYAPGEISAFVDCFVTFDGERLEPI
jgi:hypothetical protein